VEARGGGDVDDGAGGAVFDAEVGGCGADELEGLGVVEGDYGVPLFVGGLDLLELLDGCKVWTGLPCGSHRPMCSLNQMNSILWLRDVVSIPALFTIMLILPFPNSAVFFTNSVRYLSSSISPGMATACPPEALISSATFFAFATSTHQHEETPLAASKDRGLTSVNVRYHHLRALVGEQSRGLRTDALPRSSDYSDLTGKHALGVVQMSCYLLDTLARHVCCRERCCTAIYEDGVGNVDLLS